MAYVKNKQKKQKAGYIAGAIVLLVGIIALFLAIHFSKTTTATVGADVNSGADDGATTVVSQQVGEDLKDLNPFGSRGTEEETDATAPDSTTITAPTSAAPTTGNISNIPANVRSAFAAADSTYAAGHPYCIAVNTAQNLVIVYAQNTDGTFTKPVKAMVASCGKSESPTKTGTFRTSEKYQWRALNGGVYGQYATRIDGPYLFHSVPYYRQDPSTLETDEYNHLGENRSLGCVRLAVKDCKWIYENCPSGTLVTLYADASTNEPLAKPASTHIPTSGVKSGWDPTDTNPNNPWRA